MGRETVLFKSEEKKDLSEVTAFLRTLADKLDQGEVVLRQGEQSVTIEVPARVELEIKVEEEEGRNTTTRKLELEIEWPMNGDQGREGGEVILD